MLAKHGGKNRFKLSPPFLPLSLSPSLLPSLPPSFLPSPSPPPPPPPPPPLPPYFPLSLNTVEANITSPLPEHTKVNTSTPVSFSCTATGTHLLFTWHYNGKIYSSTNDCRNGACVTQTSTDDPLVISSTLSLSGIDIGEIERTLPVECRVSQSLPDRFEDIPVSSVGQLQIQAPHDTAGLCTCSCCCYDTVFVAMIQFKTHIIPYHHSQHKLADVHSITGHFCLSQI